MVDSIQILPEDIISELYLKYKNAIMDGQNTSSARRFFANNKIYEVHVKRLKEVNGFKVHNLMIKQSLRENNDSFIYINNPVESKFPRAYLTIEEFKNALINRVKAQKDELAVRKAQLNKVREKNVSTKTETSLNIKKNEGTTLAIKIPTIQVHTEIMREHFKIHTENIDVEKRNSSTKNLAYKSTKNKTSSDINYLSTFKEIQDVNLFTEIATQKFPLIRSSTATKAFNSISEDIKTTSTQTVTVQTKLLTTSNDSWSAFSSVDSKESLTEVTKEIKKETPKRKVTRTAKVREKLTAKSTKRKRSTLGRPMVFMGQ